MQLAGKVASIGMIFCLRARQEERRFLNIAFCWPILPQTVSFLPFVWISHFFITIRIVEKIREIYSLSFGILIAVFLLSRRVLRICE
jgi:hypothetical protein